MSDPISEPVLDFAITSETPPVLAEGDIVRHSMLGRCEVVKVLKSSPVPVYGLVTLDGRPIVFRASAVYLS